MLNSWEYQWFTKIFKKFSIYSRDYEGAQSSRKQKWVFYRAKPCFYDKQEHRIVNNVKFFTINKL